MKINNTFWFSPKPLFASSSHVSINKPDSATHPIPFVSFLIQYLHSPEQREWNSHICGWYCDLCVQRRSWSDWRYTATTLRFSFHVFQAVEDKNQRVQDSGNIFHPMLVSKETANCSYQGWGPSYPEVKYLGVTLDKRLTFAGVTARSTQ
jgi:hypothetical protein